MHRLLHKNIVIKPCVAVEDRHKSGNFGTVRNVIRSIARTRNMRRAVRYSPSHAHKGTGDEIMSNGKPLRRKLQRSRGQEEIVVNKRRAVGDLNKNVLSDAAYRAHAYELIFRQSVVVKGVLSNSRALRLPVEPESAGAVVDAVAADDRVNGGVELNSADLRSGEILLKIDVVYMVILDKRKSAAEMPDDTGLTAIVDIAAAHDVAAYALLRPALAHGKAHYLALCLSAVLELFPEPFIVVFRLIVLSERDSGAL